MLGPVRYYYGGEHFVNCLQQLFDKIFQSEIFPTDWSRGLIIPLFKGGPEEFRYDPGKYRGITLLSIIGKTYTSILNERLTNWIESQHLLAEEQTGFRKRRSVVDQLFI